MYFFYACLITYFKFGNVLHAQTIKFLTFLELELQCYIQ